MRNIKKSSTLESKFPLLAVEQGCIISKDGDITVAYEVTLPEIFTVTSQEYEAVHAAWCKAIKVLPSYSIVHKQDWFVKEKYEPDLQKSEMSSFQEATRDTSMNVLTCIISVTCSSPRPPRSAWHAKAISPLCAVDISFPRKSRTRKWSQDSSMPWSSSQESSTTPLAGLPFATKHAGTSACCLCAYHLQTIPYPPDIARSPWRARGTCLQVPVVRSVPVISSSVSLRKEI